MFYKAFEKKNTHFRNALALEKAFRMHSLTIGHKIDNLNDFLEDKNYSNAPLAINS